MVYFAGEETEGLGAGKGSSVDGITGFRAGAGNVMLEPGGKNASTGHVQQKRDEKRESCVCIYAFPAACISHIFCILGVSRFSPAVSDPQSE